QLAERLAVAGLDNVAPADVLIDAPPPGREVEFHVEIYYPKEDVYRPLDAVSPVTEALAKRQFDDAVKRVRVFVHPRLRSAVDALPDFDAMTVAAITDAWGATEVRA